MSKGLIHLYFGDGKGKTTASIGLAVRAAGNGNRVLVAQFLKGRPSGELAVLECLPGVSVMRGKPLTKFSWEMSEEEKRNVRQAHDAMLTSIAEQAEELALLVLDEALGACRTGLLDEAALLQFLRSKPEGLEVALTGRDPSAEMLALADYATEMKKIKHPYDQGLGARKGVEF